MSKKHHFNSEDLSTLLCICTSRKKAEACLLIAQKKNATVMPARPKTSRETQATRWIYRSDANNLINNRM
jgi:hypothetical protein